RARARDAGGGAVGHATDVGGYAGAGPSVPGGADRDARRRPDGAPHAARAGAAAPTLVGGAPALRDRRGRRALAPAPPAGSGGVGVEAAARLPPETARQHHALEERRRRIAGLAELLEHHLGDVHGRV